MVPSVRIDHFLQLKISSIMVPTMRINHFLLLKSLQWCTAWGSIIFVQRQLCLSTTDSI